MAIVRHTAVVKLCFLVLAFITIGGCIGVAAYSTKFSDGVTTGRLRVGMTQEEVRTLLGFPQAVQSRKTQVDIREVWTYQDRDLGSKHYSEDKSTQRRWNTIAIIGGALGIGLLVASGSTSDDRAVGVAALGIAALQPLPTNTHYLVFSDGRVMGWDLADPYAPDLIIEKRER